MEENKIFKQYLEKKDTYDLFGKKLVDLIEGLLINNQIDYQSISYRVKSQESFRNKLNKKKKYKDITDMTDVCGVRIISYYSDTVDKVAKIISEQFEVDEENTIDKRKALDPDKFGYLSLHYVISLKEDRLKLPEYSIFKGIKVEIQIRSISQHAWAEIEHDLGYKNKNEIPREIRRDFSRLASLLELVDKEFIEIRNKLNLYKDEVKENIKASSEAILIDSISLEQYLDSSIEIDELNSSIIKFYNCKMLNSTSNLSSTILRLEKAGFNTIQQIEEEIKKNNPHICELAKRIVLDADDDDDTEVYCDRTIGLFFLCYYNVCKEQSLNKIMQYLEESGISIENEELKQFAKELYSYYNEINK